MPPYFSNFVFANGINQHYYRSTPQNGGLAVVLLHGLTDNGLCWVRVADALRETYDVIMPDTRGHGRTDKPASGYDLAERAADVAALIDALALDRPVLMGHSLGGQAATAVAALYPEKVRGIILEDPAWLPQDSDPEQSAVRTRGWVDGLLRNQRMAREALIAEARQDNPHWPEEELGPWADAKFEMNPHALEQILTSMGGPGWRASLPKVACPILLVRAEPERGSIVSAAMAQEAAGLWKNGRDAYIPGAGHCIHREQFAPVMAEVQAFLQSLA
jgi:N-formylmaleamate deformylase